jgi:hypothetical protein
MGNFPPRALRRRQTVTVETLESRACLAADNSETIDVADHWFDRVAELREACR